MLASMITATGRKGKAWTLDEDDDEEEPATVPENSTENPDSESNKSKSEAPNTIAKPEPMEVDEDDEDPLDAFMRTVQDEVRKVKTAGDNFIYAMSGLVGFLYVCIVLILIFRTIGATRFQICEWRSEF